MWELEVEGWKAAAARTADDADDRFVALMEQAWGNLSSTGLPRFVTPSWDGGGCNDLGNGEQLALLKATDADWPEGFRPHVARVRARVLDSLVGPTHPFPFCDADGHGERTQASLEAEVDRILAEVKLTDEERKRLVARRREGFAPGPYPPEP